MAERRADRAASWALAGVALLVAAGAAFLFRARDLRGGQAEGSSFLGDPRGARALQLLLRREGWDARPLTRPVSPTLGPGVLVVLEPNTSLGDDDAQRIAAWVRAGGRLVVAGGDPGDLGRLFGIVGGGDASEAPGVAEGLDGRPFSTPAIVTRTRRGLNGGTAAYEREGVVQVATARLDGGRALFVSDAFPFANGGIDAGDNVLFVLDALAWGGRPETVWFLETFHGYSREPSMLEYGLKSGFGPLLLQLALLAVLGIWAAGARRAPVLGPPVRERRPAAEYAATVAHLYRRSSARRHVVGVARHELERFLESPAFRRAASRRVDDGLAEEARALAEQGRRLGDLSMLSEEGARAWIARAATFRRKVTHDDAR